MHPKVVLRYVQKFQKCGIKRDLTEAVRNCYKTMGVDLQRILSIDEQGSVVKNVADSCDDFETEASDVDE